MRLIRDGEKGVEGGMEVGEEGEGDYIPAAATLSWQPHIRQNNTCIKMGSDESHFNVSFIVRDKITTETAVSTDHSFGRRKGKPKRKGNKVITSNQRERER